MMKNKLFGLRHDTGEFRFHYLLNPPIERRKIDIILDALTLVLLIIMWIVSFRLGTKKILLSSLINTFVTLICIGNACRNIKTIQKKFRQVPIDGLLKVRYAHYLRAQNIIVPSIGIVVAISTAIEKQDIFVQISIVAIIAYLLILPSLFGLRKVK